MSLSGSGNGKAPKRPAAGKPIKSYPKVSGADDATIDVRKIQKPPAELPPIQEPANEPPADSVAPSEPAEPVEPAEAVAPLPEPPLPPQDKAELDGQPSPLPPSAEVPNSVEGRTGNPSPQTSEDHRPSDPTRPGWMEMPVANASVLAAEKAPFSADKVPGQTQPDVEDRTSGTDGAAMDKAGSGNVQSNESQGPFLSLGEGREEFTVPSRKSRGQASGEAIHPIAGSPQTESENVRRVENQDSVSPVVAKSELGSGLVERSAGQILHAGANQGIAAQQSGADSWGAFGGGAMPVSARPVEKVRRKVTKADNGSRVQDPARQIGRILLLKNGKVTGHVDAGQPLPVRQKKTRSADNQGRNLHKNGPVPASDGRKQKQNHAPVGHRASLVPRNGESGVQLLGFTISKNLGEYLNVIEQVTNTSLHPKQLERFLPIATTKEFLRLSPEALKIHRTAFTQEVKDKLIAEWEVMTKQKWPVYEMDIPNAKGGIYRKKGDPYDAHHIIPKSYGGPHCWENLTPARSPDEHQASIHRNPITILLFP